MNRISTITMLAVMAALLATIGDMMLLVAANHVSGSGIAPPIAPNWVRLGGAAGVIAIPFYAIGYNKAAMLLSRRSGQTERWIRMLGICIGMVGACIHLLTALRISNVLDRSWEYEGLFTVLVGDDRTLAAMWGFVLVAGTVASVIFARQVRRMPDVPRYVAWLNPALMTAAITIAVMPVATDYWYLVPAAPNLAHAIFFFACVMGEKHPARI
ncbi:MAG: hypothetical protein H6978_07850 [Gammaproteobacteria bacterium]|nr:hypothetical protein [Gammaproteobacteria bacterium]